MSRQRSTGLAIGSGLVGALALISVYLAALALLQSPDHALQQFLADAPWVTLVALGFAVQIALYTYLRQVIQAMKLAGATAMTGAGTGASTIGMLACCAHHLADIAPLVGLAGASGLSGAVAFLAAWKVPIIVFGLVVNLVGIVTGVRRIRKQRTHLRSMEASAVGTSPPGLVPCHTSPAPIGQGPA